MVKHVVVWKLKETALGNSREANVVLVREKLEALRGRIPGMVSLEVGVNTNPREPSADVVLTTVHESWQALEVYQNHPEHKAAGEFIGQVRETRACVDWEI